ncbi:hypothetical protein K4L44_09020 [Halosquirtibacter laminarini]|uniref:Uncharacterized protein n=1 Tax=Halosquirtibacter laminarini TaxID=3374600 RepID=A0AC61NBA5_9BACT|nr:hypothetical protein K4L44_09020 [Prolixibacteraceae bacterium]
MKQIIRGLVVLLFLFSISLCNAQSKEDGITYFRSYFKNHTYRDHELKKAKPLETCLSTIQADGSFSDLQSAETDIMDHKKYLNKYSTAQKEVGALTSDAMLRVWRIADAIQRKRISETQIRDVKPKLYQAIVRYGNIELLRGSITASRFHLSCFIIPTSAVNTYFIFFDDMEEVENGTNTDTTLAKVNKTLKDLSYQSWSQPFRNDDTDNHVVSIERFRNHVWWVGGNALAYRSLLPTAAAMSSTPMMDVLSTVAQRSLSSVAQNTIDTDFWTEGITADGAGWGHGRQSIVWGYPIDGTLAALSLLEYFEPTVWKQRLTAENKNAILGYIRGSSWYYYHGFIPTGLGRTGMNYNQTSPSIIKSDKVINKILSKWGQNFGQEELHELEQFHQEAQKKHLAMEGANKEVYNGTRWFYNNDDLIKKNDHSYLFINTASYRTDGTESGITEGDKYNFYTDLGSTIFLKDGGEQMRSVGAWNITSIPGTTVRQNVDPIVARTNWSGYTSALNFSAGATHGAENAVVGYQMEVMDAKMREEGINHDPKDPNPFLYGVRAFKSYFMFHDYMLALGSNIQNIDTTQKGDIWTTIEQTAWDNDIVWWEDIHNIKQASSETTHTFSKDGGKLIGAAQSDKFAYAVLPQWTTGDIILKAEKRKTNWKELNYHNRNRTDMQEEANVFHLYINHGKEVVDGTYAYVVYQGENSAQQAFANNPITILQNSKEIQAAKSNLSEAMGVVFHTANSRLEYDQFTITSDHPAVLLLESVDGQLYITVNDPIVSNDLDSLTLTLNGTLWSQHFDETFITLKLNTGHHAGKPVCYKVDTSGSAVQVEEDIVNSVVPLVQSNSLTFIQEGSDHMIYSKKQMRELSLFNCKGQKLFFNRKDTFETKLPSLQNGIYIVKALLEDGNYETKKIKI